MDSLMIGIFNSITEASNAIKELRATGFSRGISIVTKENSKYFDYLSNIKDEYQSDTTKFQGGGLIGGLLGLAVGSFVAPGIGTIIAAGPLAGAIAGSLAGETLEAALNYGITKEYSNYYRQHIAKGKSVVVIEIEDSNKSTIQEILQKYNAEDIESK